MEFEDLGKNEEPSLEMEVDRPLADVGVTGLVGSFAGASELPSLVRFFLRNPSEGIVRSRRGTLGDKRRRQGKTRRMLRAIE